MTNPAVVAPDLVAQLMKRADNYAHVYAFVGDDTMPTMRRELESALAAALAPAQTQGDATGDMLVSGSTIYVLNASGYNRWSANVQPGQDDNGKRISDDECRQIALYLAAPRPESTVPTAAAVEAIFQEIDEFEDQLSIGDHRRARAAKIKAKVAILGLATPAPTQPSEALLSKLAVASAIIGNLPELPGYNGSILTIDDTEAARISADLAEVHAALATPAPTQAHQHAWKSEPDQPGVPREVCDCGAMRSGVCVPTTAAPAAAVPPMTLREFCAEADRIGLTAETLAAQLAERPEFADCVTAAAVPAPVEREMPDAVEYYGVNDRAALPHQAAGGETVERAIEWARNNYQDCNIASLCEGMRRAASAVEPVAPAKVPAMFSMGRLAGVLAETLTPAQWTEYCPDINNVGQALAAAPADAVEPKP